MAKWIRTAVFALLCIACVPAGAAEVPRPSPALTIQGAGGPNIQIGQYKGKVVLLAFIHTTCPHCQDLTRGLIPIAREYEARGVQVVECAFNVGAGQLVPQFVQTFQPPFPVGWTDNDTVMGYLGIGFGNNRPFFVPHLVFIDRQGNIQGDYAGESDFMKTPEKSIRAELDRVLKLGPPPANTKSK
jgi:thiol-disulfide isomerase/thioredoxin